MDWQLIGLWVGIGITFLLGFFNLFWGGGILVRREKVILREPNIRTHILAPGEPFLSTSNQETSGDIVTLIIYINCLVILIKGQETEIRDVGVEFKKDVNNKLDNYFQMPLPIKVELNTEESYTQGNVFAPISLKFKKSMYLFNKLQISSTPSFNKLYKEGDTTQAIMLIKELLKKLGSDYKIFWDRYDGKHICWHLPDRWWRNLDKKILV